MCIMIFCNDNFPFDRIFPSYNKFQMGVCIGACARVEKMSPEINPN